MGERWLIIYCFHFGFTEKTIWKDSASFRTNERISGWNCVYWSDNNSHQVTDEEELNVTGMRVGAGIWTGRVIGGGFIIFFIECTIDC